MSSLAATQADGFWHPPDWNPQKESRKKYHKSKGANQWEQHGIIRFELPFNCWCLGCNMLITDGTRYNAKKIQAGNYFTTKIWEFQMRCLACPQPFVIQTDPEHRDYKCVTGLRKVMSRPSAESANRMELNSKEVREKLHSDNLFALEHKHLDFQKAKQEKTLLTKLLKLQEADTRDDYQKNQLMRSKHRVIRKHHESLAEQGKAKCLPYALADSSPEDSAISKRAFDRKLLKDASTVTKKRKNVSSQSIFAAEKKLKISKKSKELLATDKQKKDKVQHIRKLLNKSSAQQSKPKSSFFSRT